MPQRHPSAIKRNRQNIKRRVRNQTIRSAMRTEIRKVRAAIDSKDATAAGKELLNAVKVITKAATKGVIHRNTASRYVSRLSKQVAGLGA